MNIVYLTHQYLPRHVGGTEVYTHGLARRALAAGHQVTVISYHESPSADVEDFGIRRTEYDGIPLVELHYNLSVAPRPTRYEYDNPFNRQQILDQLTEIRPDVVHATHVMKLSASALDVCRELNIPFIVTLCDFWFVCPRHTLLTWDGKTCQGPRYPLTCLACMQQTHGVPTSAESPVDGLPASASSPMAILQGCLSSRRSMLVRGLLDLSGRKSFLRNVVLSAKRIVALSSFQKEMFVHNGYPAERIEVIHHGLDTAGLHAQPRCETKPRRFVFIGSLVPHKGAHILLEALHMIPKVPMQLDVYGQVRNDDYCESLKRDCRMDVRVHLRGTFERERMGEVLGNTDVLVMPAQWYENDPLVVKAAQYLGVPVMASRIGSLAEMIRDRIDGWLIDPGDPKMWAQAIESICQSDEHPRPKPRSVKTIDENADEMFEIYREVSKTHDRSCFPGRRTG